MEDNFLLLVLGEQPPMLSGEGINPLVGEVNA